MPSNIYNLNIVYITLTLQIIRVLSKDFGTTYPVMFGIHLHNRQQYFHLILCYNNIIQFKRITTLYLKYY